MQHVSNILVDLSTARDDKEEQQTINYLSSQLVEYIFMNFFLHCRGFDALFADAKRREAEKTRWSIAFTRRNFVTKKDIHFGILKLETHDKPLPPSLGEFLIWCNPSPTDLGFLTPQQAFTHAIAIISPYDDNRETLSPEQLCIIKHAIQQTDPFKLRTLPEKTVRPIFEHNYIVSLRDYCQGRIKPISKAIEDESIETLEQQKLSQISGQFSDFTGYEKGMGKVREILGMKKPASTG